MTTSSMDGPEGLSTRERLSLARGAAVAGPAAGVAVAELLLAVGSLRFALWAHVLVLAGCLGGLAVRGADGAVLATFALLPTLRLVNLGMPWFSPLSIYWLPVVYAPVLAAGALLARRPDVPTPRLGLGRTLLLVPHAAVLGVLLGELEYALATPGPLVPTLLPADLLLVTVVMVAFVGLGEELVFRGLLQGVLEDRLGTAGGLVLASLLYGLMHSAHGPGPVMAVGVAAGLLYGLVYDATKSLATVAVLHGAVNVYLFAVRPLWGSIPATVL